MLSTLGTIKSLPLYRNHFRSMCRNHKTYTPFDDSKFPYVDWEIDVEVDQYTDFQEVKDQYGEFSKDWSSIRVQEDNKYRYRQDWDDLPYYHPSDNDLSYNYYHKLGCSKQVARELERAQINRSIQTLRQWYRGDRYNVFVTVSAYIDGVCVGSDRLGGIEVTCTDDPYVADVIDELKRNIAYDIPKQVQEKLNQTAKIYAKVND